MKILFHICCAPCSIFPIEKLKAEGHELHGLFYNPNIHPFTEYKMRRDTVQRYFESQNLPLIILDEYDIKSFLRECAYREDIRCQMCYSKRLERAASVAKKGNFDAFTTSLLVSPFQKHDLIKKIGEQTEAKYSIKFLYMDFREGFKEGNQKAKELNLYRQQYCGCIYSEEERYLSKKNRSEENEH